MMSGGHSDSGLNRTAEGRRFATTDWSVVVKAGQGGTEEARAALAHLCRDYWYPLYAFLRRRGHQSAEAQDLTQGFLAHVIEKGTLQAADQSRGRFRSFLLSSLNHFLAHQWRHTRAQKRGGGKHTFSLDLQEGEKRYLLEPIDTSTPETIFERRWALTLLEKAVQSVRAEYEQAGKLTLFDALKNYLGGSDDSVPYHTIATTLDITPGAARVAAHRLRQRCRRALRHEIAQTVASPEEVDEELRYLFQAVQD